MLPKKLREVWGEEVIEAFLPWLEEFIKEKAPTRDEHREIISKLDTIELRVGNLEKRMDMLEIEVKDLRKEMNERFDKINERFDKINERFDKMNQRFDKINERFGKMNERFDTLYTLMASSIKWTVGTLALFGTLITILLAIGQFFK
jgi:chaperonin cofactor prefoldin